MMIHWKYQIHKCLAQMIDKEEKPKLMKAELKNGH